MSREDPAKDQGAQVAPHDERRRSQRARLRVSVKRHVRIPEIPETIEAQTAEVNDHGALLTCPENFPTDAPSILGHKSSRPRVGCRVTRTPSVIHGGFPVAVEFDTATPGFWHISFPPADGKGLEE